MVNWSNIEQALLITMIGVTLIFVVLLVMWGFMALLVRLAAPRPEPAKAQATTAISANDDAAVVTRRKAAVVAVAVALAIEAERARSALLLQSAPGPISPWQATLRGNALSRRAGAFRRNPPAR
jgi:Na+-transporting methylmalonyl-CoA/oxaloacetate decarboxylase gamma subunit